MKRVLFAALCLALAARATTAQVQDGSSWTDGAGTTATTDVTETGETGCTVTVTDATGFTEPLSGTQSSGSTENKPAAQSSAAGETNSPQPNEYRVKNGKLQKKKNGKWVDMRRVVKRQNLPKPPIRAEAGGGIEIGEEGTSAPGPLAPKPL